MRRLRVLLLLLMCVLCAAVFPSVGEASDIEEVLPVPGCAEGWTIEGKVTRYTRDTLFERINGESELYFPYGFEILASARYTSSRNPQFAVEADVYKMGSLLDAFGIYANYRRADDVSVRVGAEGFVSSSQLLFYQDRYFVKLQASGTLGLDPEIFLSCAGAISENLPQNTAKPGELEAFMIPAVVRKSERYVAQSLLGYAFFRRGIIAETTLEGSELKAFVVPEESPGAARTSLEQYLSYLKASGQDVEVTTASEVVSATAVDPLYKTVFVEQAGPYVIGAIQVKEAAAAKQLVEQLRRRLVR